MCFFFFSFSFPKTSKTREGITLGWQWPRPNGLTTVPHRPFVFYTTAFGVTWASLEWKCSLVFNFCIGFSFSLYYCFWNVFGSCLSSSLSSSSFSSFFFFLFWFLFSISFAFIAVALLFFSVFPLVPLPHSYFIFLPSSSSYTSSSLPPYAPSFSFFFFSLSRSISFSFFSIPFSSLFFSLSAPPPRPLPPPLLNYFSCFYRTGKYSQMKQFW